MNALQNIAPELTMSSEEIATLVESRHDNVKTSIERLGARGVIQLPALQEVRNHLGQTVSVYQLCKRDSYVVVAQLSPEFTARLVDRWQELEAVAFATWSIDPSGWERIDRQMFLFIASVVAWLRYACGLIRRQA